MVRLAGAGRGLGLPVACLPKKELCEVIKRQAPQFVYLESSIAEDPDKRDYIVSNAKLEATGFKPRYSLDDGIGELIKGYQMIWKSPYGNV